MARKTPEVDHHHVVPLVDARVDDELGGRARACADAARSARRCRRSVERGLHQARVILLAPHARSRRRAWRWRRSRRSRSLRRPRPACAASRSATTTAQSATCAGGGEPTPPAPRPCREGSGRGSGWGCRRVLWRTLVGPRSGLARRRRSPVAWAPSRRRRRRPTSTNGQASLTSAGHRLHSDDQVGANPVIRRTPPGAGSEPVWRSTAVELLNAHAGAGDLLASASLKPMTPNLRRNTARRGDALAARLRRQGVQDVAAPGPEHRRSTARSAR